MTARCHHFRLFGSHLGFLELALVSAPVVGGALRRVVFAAFEMSSIAIRPVPHFGGLETLVWRSSCPVPRRNPPKSSGSPPSRAEQSRLRGIGQQIHCPDNERSLANGRCGRGGSHVILE